jgi:uncharacterized Tic20 family protein
LKYHFERGIEMSDEEKELRDEVEAKAEVEGEDEVKVKAEVEDEVKAEAGVEEVVAADADQEVAEPVRAALAAGPEIGPSSNERLWAALAHASVLLTFILGIATGGLAVVIFALVPLVIWLAFRDKSRFVAFHALQATVFQLGALAAWVGLAIVGVALLIPAWIITVLLMVILIGFLLLPLTLVLTVALPTALVVMPLAVLVYGLYAALEVYAGREFRYWLVADWIEKRGVQSPSTELALQPANQ